MQPVNICRKIQLPTYNEKKYEEPSLQTRNEIKYETIQLILMWCNGNIIQKRNKIFNYIESSSYVIIIPV